MITLMVIAFTVLIVGAVFFFGRRSGADAIKKDVMQGELDDIHKAAVARRSVKPTDSLHDDQFNRDNM